MISIIIPTYNRTHLITETLESILLQSYTDWECIIVDDCSTDNSDQTIGVFLEKDERFKYFKRPIHKKKGANACRNFGFEQSKGEYIQFFDSDDIMHPAHLEKKMQILEGNSSYDLCTCTTQNFYGVFNENNRKETSKNEFTGNLYEDYILGRCSILMITPTWKRSVLEQIPLFDENLQQSQDLELYSRVLLRHQNIKLIQEVLIYVRRNNESISTTINGQLNFHLDSYLEVKKRILQQSPNNKNITIGLTKNILGVFRYKLALKQYSDSERCLRFISTNVNFNSLKYRISFLKICIFYKLFKSVGRGDTRFKMLLKL